VLLRSGGARVALHLRGQGMSGGELWAIASPLSRLAARTGSWLIVNDRIDLALAVGARGVQLGRGSMDPITARRLLPPATWIGVSVHEPAEAARAVEEGADYLLAGTLFPSGSHPGEPGRGVAWLEPMIGLGVPVIGIGGIGPERVHGVRSAGAYGVAVIEAVWSAADRVAAMQQLIDVLEVSDG